MTKNKVAKKTKQRHDKNPGFQKKFKQRYHENQDCLEKN